MRSSALVLSWTTWRERAGASAHRLRCMLAVVTRMRYQCMLQCLLSWRDIAMMYRRQRRLLRRRGCVLHRSSAHGSGHGAGLRVGLILRRLPPTPVPLCTACRLAGGGSNSRDTVRELFAARVLEESLEEHLKHIVSTGKVPIGVLRAGAPSSNFWVEDIFLSVF